jgi:hypothetical protein
MSQPVSPPFQRKSAPARKTPTPVLSAPRHPVRWKHDILSSVDPFAQSGRKAGCRPSASHAKKVSAHGGEMESSGHRPFLIQLLQWDPTVGRRERTRVESPQTRFFSHPTQREISLRLLGEYPISSFMHERQERLRKRIHRMGNPYAVLSLSDKEEISDLRERDDSPDDQTPDPQQLNLPLTSLS